jgi:hypothetical protein
MHTQKEEHLGKIGIYCIINKDLLFSEGQLPRGALYLDHKMNSKEEEKSYVSPNEICKYVFMG